MCKIKEKFDIILFWLCIIDLIFLPYFPLISTNFSIILIGIWSIKNLKNVILKKENLIFLIMILLMITSTILSIMIYPRFINEIDIPIYNIKVCIQFIVYFLYFIFFRYIFKNYKINIKKIIIFAFGFAAFLALIYVVDKNLFAHIKLFWNNDDFFTLTFLNEPNTIQYRYNFIWTDPNNPAYFFVALLFLFLTNNIKSNLKEKIFIFACFFIILITCMSSGGILSFFITAFLYLILKNFVYNKDKISVLVDKIKQNYKKLIFIVLILIIGFICIKDISIFKESIDRITNNSLSSRVNIWLRILKNTHFFRYLIFGTGGTQVILNDGTLLLPHSGELYLIYSFGLIYLCLFMHAFFRKSKNVNWLDFLFVLPIFIGFSINTVVGEQKLFILYLMIYAYSIFKVKENKIKKYDLKKKDLVSVVVPVYNAENYLERCILSITNQTYKNIELLLIDDGSKDKSLEICQKFAFQDNRIKVFHHENNGVSYTRNRGINEANGKYIMFVDSDDFISPNMIHDMLAEYDYKTDLVISGIVMKNKESEIISTHTLPDGKYKLKKLIEMLEIDIPLICICGPCCKLYKTDIIKKNNLKFSKDLTMGEDTDFNIQYYYFAKEMKLMSNIYYSYMRENENSLFTKYYPDFIYLNDKVFARFLNLIKDKKFPKQTILHFQKIYFQILFSSNNTNFKNKKLNTKEKRIKDLNFLINHDVTKEIIKTKPNSIKEKIIFKFIKNNNINCLYYLFYLRNI